MPESNTGRDTGGGAGVPCAHLFMMKWSASRMRVLRRVLAGSKFPIHGDVRTVRRPSAISRWLKSRLRQIQSEASANFVSGFPELR